MVCAEGMHRNVVACTKQGTMGLQWKKLAHCSRNSSPDSAPPPPVYRAPGRVNLIGEHTDYNEGFVLPAAIGFSCWVAIAQREDRKLIIHSENFGASVEVDLDKLPAHGSGAWSDYPVGVAWAHVQAGNHPRGANLFITGEVPLGSGLSSSAAVEVSVGYAMQDIAKQAIDRTKLALLCQRAENEFVGARCGIMDQFVSCHGQADMRCCWIAVRWISSW